MNTPKNILWIGFAALLLVLWGHPSCSTSRLSNPLSTDTLRLNPAGQGNFIEFEFRKGPEHNHPVMALWITDTSNAYLQTLYVAQSISRGRFEHGDKASGFWQPGSIRRPAALPVWAHSRNIPTNHGDYLPTEAHPVPDAYTGATPPGNFLISTYTDQPLPPNIFIYFEINQTWDWNQFWNNSRYPDDTDYQSSCQPALVYRARADNNGRWEVSPFELLGHSHYNGSDGEIYPDVSTLTTAKEITEQIRITIQ